MGDAHQCTRSRFKAVTAIMQTSRYIGVLHVFHEDRSLRSPMTAKRAMLPSIETLLRPVVDRLTTAPKISTTDIPMLPATVVSETLIVRKSTMGYSVGFGLSPDRDEGSYFRADVLNFLSTRDGYIGLVATLVSVLLQRSSPDFDVLLVAPTSQVKALRLQRADTDDAAHFGLAVVPTSFTRKLDRIAALHALSKLDDHRKPRFLLTHKDDASDGAEPWKSRDHVRLATSEIGLLLLASALMDYALRGTPERELTFRAPPLMAAAALGMCSAEARFWLPGSLGWHFDDDTGA